MAKYKVFHEDIVELNMAIENDRPIAEWTAKRVYSLFSKLKPGDKVEIEPGLVGEAHYIETFGEEADRGG